MAVVQINDFDLKQIIQDLGYTPMGLVTNMDWYDKHLPVINNILIKAYEQGRKDEGELIKKLRGASDRVESITIERKGEWL